MTATAARWSDDGFLDALAGQGDRAADACFAALGETLSRQDFGRLFRTLDRNDVPLAGIEPPPLRDFLERSVRLPALGGTPVDLARIDRGARVFLTHALLSALVLLAKSLPEGYAAPRLSRILCLSDNLRRKPYRRVLGVVQMLVDVSSPGSFEPAGKALITIPKIRLLHAGVRHIVRREMPDYETAFGAPVNLEDMLGTVMGFSLLVVEGLRRLEVGLSDREAEDYFYLWRVFAQMMGIHPEGEPDSDAWVPASLAEAETFYSAFRRRHFTAAADNPEGVALAGASLQLLNDLLPQTPLRRLGLKIVPRIYMADLIGRVGCARVGIAPVPLLFLTKWLLRQGPMLWTRLWGVADRFDPSREFHENVGRLFFEGLITREFGGEVAFRIPDELAELRGLVDPQRGGARMDAEQNPA